MRWYWWTILIVIVMAVITTIGRGPNAWLELIIAIPINVIVWLSIVWAFRKLKSYWKRYVPPTTVPPGS